MIDSGQVPVVADAERLARYVLFSGHKRADGTVKSDAFIPHPRQELSVTRHRDATIDEIWAEGRRVSKLRDRHLFGHADILAGFCRGQNLEVDAAPIQDNPNHANVHRWPPGKPQQKLIAQELAKSAGKLRMWAT